MVKFNARDEEDEVETLTADLMRVRRKNEKDESLMPMQLIKNFVGMGSNGEIGGEV